MTVRLWSFFVFASSILAACGEVLVPDGGDTSPPDTATTTATTSTATNEGGGGAGPSPSCPAELTQPADCGDFADACAGALPIAGGGDTAFARGVALDDTFVYWVAERSGLGECGGVIYRTPRTGGPSTRFVDTPSPWSYEVDDAALYVVDVQGLRVFDTSTGAATNVGPIDPGGVDADTYGVAYDLARTPGGMIAYGNGQWTPSFFRVDHAGTTPIATNVGSKGYLGSVPSFDGTSLFFAWEPEPWTGLSPLVRTEAGSTATTELAAGAAIHLYPSVVASDDDVFFITGDPAVSFGNVEHPMGIARVPKAGGAVTVLVPPGPVMIDQLLVDATDVYFSTRPLIDDVLSFSIQSVPRAGGVVRTVWTSTTHPDALRQDETALYFALDVSKGKSEVNGVGLGGLIVKVEKAATAP